MFKNQKIYLAGIKPTGKMHLGHFFGIIQPILNIAKKNPKDLCIFYIADLHSIVHKISEKDKFLLIKKNTLILFRELKSFTCGYENIKIILQSSIKNILKLSYIFTDFLSLNKIFMFHAYKQFKQEKKNINLSLVYYPFLMAADILSLGTDYLVVASDQLQHLEITKFISKKISGIMGITFDNVEIYDLNLKKQKNILYSKNGLKMSKSNGVGINLFCNSKELKKYIFSIVTLNKVIIDKNMNKDNNLLFQLLYFFDSKFYNKIKQDKKNNFLFKDIKKKVFLYMEQHFKVFKQNYDLFSNHAKLLKIFKQNYSKNKEFIISVENRINKIFNKIFINY